MRIVLTTADLEMMPAALRRDLMLFLAVPPAARAAGASPGGESPTAAADLAILNRQQAIALIRSVSFGKRFRILRELIEALAYRANGDAPTSEHLISMLRLKDDRELQRNLNAVKRLVELATHDPSARLARYLQPEGIHVVHQVTRDILREELTRLARSGEAEEALWA